MWLVRLKEVLFTLCIYEDIIWFIKNTAVTFLFCTKWDLRVLTSSAKSMNRELSFVVRAQFWRGRTKEFAILLNRIFPTLLATWSRQQYPYTWVKLSFIVLISQSDKKEEHFLPSPCTAFSQFLSVNSLRWRIRGEWKLSASRRTLEFTIQIIQ